MDNVFLLLRKLKHGNVAKENFIGIINILVLSNELFKRNADVADYVRQTFDIKLLPYAVRSRTIIIAKLCRVLVQITDMESRKLSKKTYDYIASNFEIDNNKISLTKNKNSNALANMEKWIDGILSKK
ncbi:TPA: hypothetical protein RG697_003419 [Morganella morganii]|uniref:Uncharacterized protein n=1 Tax=bacterium 19GA11TI05 TaxID=2920688 RepID=A0AAU6TT25_UNCXX|nr:hypothetical protein [Morganella morganii]MDW7794212.1 hypothetical protein [Morganella morganii]HCT3284840.1 hypothetical protein [Morganella morganii]HDU8611757.1 hypothetical protein [Morganella morganii]HEI8462053.1 hypothetical protein [Morganella morganii]